MNGRINRDRHVRLALAFLCWLPAGAAAADRPEDADSRGDGAVSRVYRVQFLNPQDAVMIAQQLCLAQPGRPVCEYQFSGKNWFTFTADESVQDKIQEEITRLDAPPPSLNFRLSLMMAGSTGGPDPDLPRGEREALADLKQFLPFKAYRLIDSGWIRSRESADLRLGSQPAFEMRMRFTWDSASGNREILVERFALRRASYEEKTEDNEVRGIAPLDILQSSFAMKVGETVVVGTSRLNGNEEALVVLLSAEE